MSITNEFVKTEKLFNEFGVEKYQSLDNLHLIKIRPQELSGLIEFLREDLDFIFLLDLTIDVASKEQKNFDYQLIYLLLNLNTLQRVMIEVSFYSQEWVPSLGRFYQNAQSLECDLIRNTPINFFNSDHSSIFKQVIIPSEYKIPEIRKNPNRSEEPFLQEKWIWKELSLFSKSTQGNFSLMACFDPEKLVDLKVKTGFYYRGVERSLEGKDPRSVGRLIDPLIFDYSPHFSLCWFKMIEDIFSIDIPEKAQALRIILLELARIVDHFTVISEILISLNLNEFKLFLDAREKMLNLIDHYSRSRWSFDSIQLGGVKFELPHGWLAEYQDVTKLVLKNIKLINDALMTQYKFRSFLDTAGVTSQMILSQGVTGPAMRACGLNFDLRKSSPFYFYKDIDFDVPVGIKGTAFDRYLIRFEEVLQSFRILTQVLDNLPLGDFKIQKDEIEDHFVNPKYLSKLPSWFYTGIESPNGEIGIMAKIGTNLKTDKIKMKSSSLVLAQSLNKFLYGLTEVQLASHIASLGIRKSEMDR